ncbi:autotransporter domain-containing protein [Parapusillimonas sp. SGNA-6]|nr:autotransporter domain-containing protein [Parapusillimonas sp. SGNA-6]
MKHLLGAGLLACVAAANAQVGDGSQFIDAEFQRSKTLGLIGAQHAYERGYTGKGVILAVVDSGLDVGHPEFRGRISPWAYNFIPGYAPTDLSDVKRDGSIEGHGTHVAGLAAAARDGVGMHGVAYNATVLPLRTRFAADELPSAYDRAIQAGAQVLNGSYGPITLAPKYIVDPETGDSYKNDAFRELDYQPVIPRLVEGDSLRKAADADIVMVFSAGNSRHLQPGKYTDIPSGNAMVPLITPSNTAAGFYKFLDVNAGTDPYDPDTWSFFDPATTPWAAQADFSDLRGALIAVVATDPDGLIAYYSNRCGLAAPWCLAAPGGGGAGSDVYSTFPYSTYGDMSGTSMAAPVVAGAAAVLREAFPYMSARQIIEVMLTTTNNSGLWSDQAVYGRGMLDLGKAVKGPAYFGDPLFSRIFSVDTKGHDSVWSNDIGGPGGLRKAGAGTLTLTGMNGYTGETTIVGGKLVVNGSIVPSSLLTIGADAVLGGGGRVGKTALYGRVAPGNSVGTLTVEGDYTQYPGSVFEVELGPGGLADRLVVQGTADVQGGAIEVHGLTSRHLGQQFSFMEADAWLGRSFDTSALARAFIDMQVAAEGNGTSLSVRRNEVSFASLGQTANQRAVAGAVDQQTVGVAPFDDLVVLDDPARAPGIYDALSGEIYASTSSALIDTGGILRRTVLARASQAPQWAGGLAAGPGVTSGLQGRPSMWGQVLGQWGALSGGAEADRLKRSVGGLVLGGDAAVGRDMRVGVSAGYTAARFDGISDSRAQADGYHLLGYAGMTRGHWAFRAGLGQSWYDVDTRRPMSYASWGTASSHASASSTQLFAEAGYGIDAGRWSIQPYAGVAQVWLRQGGFTERNSPVALQSDSVSSAVTFSTLGVRGSVTFDDGRHGVIRAQGGLGWRHAFGDVKPSRDLRFTSGEAFRVQGAPLARDAMLLELGVDWATSERSNLSFTYTAELGGGSNDQGVQARLAWRF